MLYGDSPRAVSSINLLMRRYTFTRAGELYKRHCSAPSDFLPFSFVSLLSFLIAARHPKVQSVHAEHLPVPFQGWRLLPSFLLSDICFTVLVP